MNSKDLCQCDHAQELEKAFLVITQLQETNANVHSNLEAVLVEGDRKICLLEQEKHDMELRLSRQAMMAQSYQDDLEALQRELNQDKKKAVKEMESKMSELTAKHKLELSNMEGDLGRVKVVEAELVEQNARLEGMVEKLKAQLKMKELERSPSESFSAGPSEEMEVLKKENLAILEENCLLQLKLERTEEQLVGWKNQVSVKDYELSKLACESVTYFNENERLKEKIKDLQVELEVVTMQSNKRQAKGNSLFAEVEDRRVEVERQLIDIRIENDSLKKQLKITRDSLNQAKMQLSVKWDIRSAMEYKNRLETVRAENTKLLEENRLLNYRIKALEEEEQRMKSVILQNDRSDVPEVRRYQVLFESSEKKLRNLTGVLEKKTTTLHLVENRLRDSESALLSAKQELFNINSEKDKIKRRLDELISKYEPDNRESQQKQLKVEYHTEKLNFASRKKFQQTATGREDGTHHAAPTSTETSVKEKPSLSTNASKSSRQSSDPSLQSEPSKGLIPSCQNRELLNRQEGESRKVSFLEGSEKGADLSRKTCESEENIAQGQDFKVPIGTSQSAMKPGKENSNIPKLAADKEQRRESEKKEDESNKVMSLHDELAMLMNAPGMKSGYNPMSQDNADNDDDDDDEHDTEIHILKDSNKGNICSEHVDGAKVMKGCTINTKVSSNSDSDCPSTINTNSSADKTYDKKKNVDACKTQ